MNVNQIFTMISRIVMRKLISKGVNKGIDHVAGKGKPRAEMTQAERVQARKGRQAAKRARQAARMTRKIGRF